jgi:hypothetical protein
LKEQVLSFANIGSGQQAGHPSFLVTMECGKTMIKLNRYYSKLFITLNMKISMTEGEFEKISYVEKNTI